jgi:hypothetical protein
MSSDNPMVKRLPHLLLRALTLLLSGNLLKNRWFIWYGPNNTLNLTDYNSHAEHATIPIQK